MKIRPAGLMSFFCDASLAARRLVLLLILLAFCLLCGALAWWQGARIDTSMMALLPTLRDDPVLLQALQSGNRAISGKWLMVVGPLSAAGDVAGDATVDAAVDAAADQLAATMRSSQLFRRVDSGVALQQGMDVGAVYFAARPGLLSDRYRQWLQAGDWVALQSSLQKALYSPVSGVNSALLQRDPLLSFRDFMNNLPRPQGNVQVERGNLVVRSGDMRYRVLIGDFAGDVFDISLQQHYRAWLAGVDHQMNGFAGVRWHHSGAMDYALQGTADARRDVQLISHLSTFGIALMLWLVFRSGRMLLFPLLPILAGVLAGTACTLALFGNLHLLTLVFASSVIGIAIDYALHYLTDCAKGEADQAWQPAAALQRILPGTGLGLLTSLIAYAGIGMTPFPLLRQIAVFCCSGLLVSWFSVFCLAPYWRLPVSADRARWLAFSAKLDVAVQRFFARRQLPWLMTGLLLLCAPLLWQLQVNDDLRQLQQADVRLRAEEQSVRSLLGVPAEGRFVLLEGRDNEQLLQRDETLREMWQQQADVLADGLSRWVPSLQRQQENAALLRQPSVRQFMAQWQTQLGLQTLSTDAASNQSLTLDALQQQSTQQQSTLSNALQRYLWQQTARGVIAAVFLPAGLDAATQAKLRALTEQMPGAHWVDTTADIANLLGHYRQRTVWLALCAYALIALLLACRYPWRTAFCVLLGPLLAVYVTLLVFAACGISLHLFHVLALLLVLGVGTDYSIFFAESGERRDAAMLAVLLSAFSTWLSFGLLVLSSTAAIRGFGLVVCIGIACALLFAPLARRQQELA